MIVAADLELHYTYTLTHAANADCFFLPSGGMHVWFNNSADHGSGYPGAPAVLQAVVKSGSGCRCQRSVVQASQTSYPPSHPSYDDESYPPLHNTTQVIDTNLSGCLRVVVAHGARLEPVPQRLMRPAYCMHPEVGELAGEMDVMDRCRDIQQRDMGHPWLPANEARQIAGVDLTRPWLLPTQGAVALAPLTLWNESFLVVACYAPLEYSKSKVFRLMSLPANLHPPHTLSFASMRVEEVQSISTYGARDVDVFYDASTGDALLLFALRGDTGSQLFRWRAALRHQASASGRGMLLPQLELVQTVATVDAMRISSTPSAATVYVTIAQGAGAMESLVMRWNATHLIGIVTTSNLPKDVAGGQVLPSSSARAIGVWDSNGATWVLMANSLNRSALAPHTIGQFGQCNQNGRTKGPCHLLPGAVLESQTQVFSSLYRVAYEAALDMKRPSALAISPDGRMVYVAASSSQSISCFLREMPYGELEYHGEGSFSVERTHPTHSASFESVWPETEEGSLRRPLEGLSDIAITKNGDILLATAAFESALYIFERNVTGGELRLVQVIRDGERLGDGRLVDCLGGASSVALADPWVYVTSFNDHCVSVFKLVTGAKESKESRQSALNNHSRFNITSSPSSPSNNATSTANTSNMDRVSSRIPDCDAVCNDLCVKSCVATTHGDQDYQPCLLNCINSQSVYLPVEYVDRVRESERLVDQFPTRAQLKMTNESWKTSSEPRRLGGASLPWANRSRASVSFRIEGEVYLAVAASSGDGDGSGTLGVFKWNAVIMTFELRQTLVRDWNPSDVKFVEQPGLASAATRNKHLLVVSNLGPWPTAPSTLSATPVHMYLFDTKTGEFQWYQRLSFMLPNGREVPPFSTQSSSLPPCAAGYLRHPRAPSLVYQKTGSLDYCNTHAAPVQDEGNSRMSGYVMNATNATNATPTTSTTAVPAATDKLVYDSDFLKVPSYGCIPQPLVQSLKIWNQGYTTYLAAAYIWDQPANETYKWYSLVWRWNRDGFVVLENGERVDGFGFEVFQLIPTSGATDVEMMPLPPSPTRREETFMLIFSNLLDARKGPKYHGSYTSQSFVYRFTAGAWNPLVRASSGYFQLTQSLPTVGAMSLKAMVVSNHYSVGEGGVVTEENMYLLGIASMQPNRSHPPSLPSHIYRWDSVQEKLVAHQLLHPPASMAFSSMEVVQQGRETHLILTSFSGIECPSAPSPSSNTSSSNTSSTTSGKFRSKTETEGSTVRILQWDRVTKMFDRLMAITDTDSHAIMGFAVPAVERRIHDAALILQLEDSVHAEVIIASPDLTLLAISSVSSGLMMFEWRFSKAAGLYGASKVAVDGSGSLAFVAGAASRAVALVSKQPIVDAEGVAVRQVTWLETWSQGPIPINRLRLSQDQGVEGVAGIVKLQLEPWNCSFIAAPKTNLTNTTTNSTWYPECLTLVAQAAPPRYNLPCGPIPPVPVTQPELPNGGLATEFVAARCHEARMDSVPVPVSSVIAPVGMHPILPENPSLFPEVPRLSSSGILNLFAAMDAYGDAAFALLVLKERAAADALRSGTLLHDIAAIAASHDIGDTRGFAVSVVPVRLKPSFMPVHVTVNEDAGAQVLKFATNVMSGDPYASQDALLDYKWRINSMQCNATSQGLIDLSTSSNKASYHKAVSSVFTRPPCGEDMKTYLLNDMSAYGAVRMEWAAHQYGECWLSISVYDSTLPQWESEPQMVRMRARPVNDAPNVTIAQQLTINQGCGRTTLANFVKCLSWAPDARPSQCDPPIAPNASPNASHCLPASQSAPFGSECGALLPMGALGADGEASVGPFCAGVVLAYPHAGLVLAHHHQTACWFSMQLVNVEKVLAPGPPWDAQARELLGPVPDALVLIHLHLDALVLAIHPAQFGLFRITLSFTDKGGTDAGGVDSTTKHFWLQVVQQVVAPVIALPVGREHLHIAVFAPPSPMPASASGSEEGDPDDSDDSADAEARVEEQLSSLSNQEQHAILAQQEFVALLREVPLGNVSRLNIVVSEIKFYLHQHYADFLQDISNGAGDQEMLNKLTTSIVELSSSHLFLGGQPNLRRAFPANAPLELNDVGQCTGCPALGVVDGRPGSLSFTLAPFRYGIASMLVRLESLSPLANTTAAISTYRFHLVVLPVNDAPSANVATFLGLPQGVQDVVVPLFASNVSVGPENEAWQEAVFHVYSVGDTPGLLTTMPTIDARGTLSLSLWPAAHGRIRLRIMLSDTGGNANGGRNTSAAFPVDSEIMVFPRPHIVSVSPCVGIAGGGWTITIRGMYFGSAYSSDTSDTSDTLAHQPHTLPHQPLPWSPLANHVEVHVGHQPCNNTRFVSDTMLVCDVPPGAMRRLVQVTVGGGRSVNKEGRVLSDWSGRQANYSDGVVHPHVYIAGASGVKAATSSPSLSPWAPWPMRPDHQPSTVPGHLPLCTTNTTNTTHLTNSSNSTQNCTNQGPASTTAAGTAGGTMPPTTTLPASHLNGTNTSHSKAEQATSLRGVAGGGWLDGGGQGGLLAVSPAMDCAGSSSVKVSSSLPNGSTSMGNASTFNASTFMANASATHDCGLDQWNGEVRYVPPTLSSLPNLAAHVLSRSVRAIATFESQVVLGGSFLGHSSNTLDYLLRWDGGNVEPMGGGLDGTVYALANLANLLVVAGSFSQLYQVLLILSR